jgi:hypothetical protein
MPPKSVTPPRRDRGAQPETDTRPQHERFIETARAVGCDEDEAAFRDKLRLIARQKPKAEPKSPPRDDGATKRRGTRGD